MSDLTYWSQTKMSPAKLNEQIGVFAGSSNCAIESCPLVKSPVEISNALSIFWYVPTNPFVGPVPASTLFPLTGLDAPGIGTSNANGHNAMATDGLGSLSMVMAPAGLAVGSAITVVPGVDLYSSPASPWTDRSAAFMRINLQHPFSNIPFHDGTVNDGLLYFYLTFTLIAPGVAPLSIAPAEHRHPRSDLWEHRRRRAAGLVSAAPRIQYVARLYQDKYSDHDPSLTRAPNCVFPYAGGALVSTTLGQGQMGEGPFGTSWGEGTFTLNTSTFRSYVVLLDHNQLSSVVRYVNAQLGLSYPTDASKWRIAHFALDVESVGVGTTNPQLGLSWNGLALGATNSP